MDKHSTKLWMARRPPHVEKVEVRVFLPRPVVEAIDSMIQRGEYSTRSEAIRCLVRSHLLLGKPLEEKVG